MAHFTASKETTSAVTSPVSFKNDAIEGPSGNDHSAGDGEAPPTTMTFKVDMEMDMPNEDEDEEVKAIVDQIGGGAAGTPRKLPTHSKMSIFSSYTGTERSRGRASAASATFDGSPIKHG